MTEEVKQELEQEKQVHPEQEDPQKAEALTIEDRAREMGWRPREEFHGDDADFIDAKEFINRKPLFDKIEAQGKQLKDVLRALNNLKQHYTMVRDTEYKRALDVLKKQRSAAIKEGDGDTYEELDDHITRIEKEAADLQVLKQEIPEEQPVHPEFQNWLTRNSWYQSVGYMRAFADQVGAELHGRGMSREKVLKGVEEAVRAEFPDKFRNRNKQDAPRVDSDTKGSGSGKRESGLDLTPQEKKIMGDFLRMKNPDGTPFMTKEQYISDLKKAKGLE